MLSIVIPVLNEQRALPATLERVLSQGGDYDVTVVDGGSTDKTCDIVRAYPDIKLIHTERGRANQMNAGARLARGDWLLFLHADTLLPLGAVRRLNVLARQGRCEAGGFRHEFSGDDWRLRFISFLDNRRCEKTRVIYGDQAMFIRRRVFDGLGGFPQQPVMEDVAFCERLVKRTCPVLLNESVVTDSRKFVQMGVWRSLYRVLLIQIRHELGMPVAQDSPFFSNIR